MNDWFVSQPIVCVDGKRYPEFGHGREVLPVEKNTYTIREIVPRKDGSIGFLLNEITNKPNWYVEGLAEFSFAPRRFRPVINPEADLSVFEAILRGVEKREVVEA